jgi:hypothetical protein
MKRRSPPITFLISDSLLALLLRFRGTLQYIPIEKAVYFLIGLAVNSDGHLPPFIEEFQ